VTIKFGPPLHELSAGTPAYIGARCEVLHNGTVIGYFERHDFGSGAMPSSGKIMLDIEDIPPSSCYAFRDRRGMTQFASRDRDAMLERIRQWAGK
jgi:hypothetical protein